MSSSYKLEPSPFVRFIMILMALIIVTRPLVKLKSGASCSGYEIVRVRDRFDLRIDLSYIELTVNIR